MKKIISAFLLLLTICTGSLRAAEFSLVKDGRPVARIVLSPGFSPQEAYAAMELSDYIGKITGAVLPIGLQKDSRSYNVILSCDYQALPRTTAARRHLLRHDGYLLDAGPDGLCITSLQPLGVLYGVYDLLKKQGGIRWLIPGEEGESYSRSRDFTVPEQQTCVNPSFRFRNFNLTGCISKAAMLPTVRWMLRNNLQPFGPFMNPVHQTSGHDLWTYLPRELYQTHPEIFPMQNGRRILWPKKSIHPVNPCITSPLAMETIQKNILKTLSSRRNINWYCITQNDSTSWCECDACRKLDSPADRLCHGVSNRFWTYANQVTANIKQHFPSMKIQVSAYLNAENPPDQVVPSRAIDQLLMFQKDRCMTHSLDDPSCIVNRKYRERIAGWLKFRIPVKLYQYSPFIPQGTQIYSPTEEIFVKDFRYYRKLGIAGYGDERPPLTENPRSCFVRHYYPVLADSWYYDAIPRYIQASFLWNTDGDFQAVLDDFGSRYYGPAWPSVSRYRTLLRRCYAESGTHFICFGSPSINLGKCLMNDQAHRELNRLLDEALRTAGDSGKYKERVLRDVTGFRGWEMQHEQYLKLNALKAEVPAIRGKSPVEKDWERARPCTDFVNARQKKLPRTSAKVLYSQDSLFFRIRADEPSPGLMVTRKTRQDDKLWEDNSLEIFIAPPELGGRYLHLVFNAAGVRFDAMTLHATNSDIAYDSGSVIRTRILPDAWTADVQIPFSALGAVPGAGAVWKVNIARSRRLTDGTAVDGSWSNGVFHGHESYRNLYFLSNVHN